MPRAGQPPLRSKDALDERCTVMGAFASHGLDGTIVIDKEDLAAFDTLDLDLLLLANPEGKG